MDYLPELLWVRNLVWLGSSDLRSVMRSHLDVSWGLHSPQDMTRAGEFASIAPHSHSWLANWFRLRTGVLLAHCGLLERPHGIEVAPLEQTMQSRSCKAFPGLAWEGTHHSSAMLCWPHRPVLGYCSECGGRCQRVPLRGYLSQYLLAV